MARPSPVPCPWPDQNGRKINSCSAAGTPGPVSETLTATRPFARSRASDTRPPSGVQSNAFTSRLETICNTRSPSVASVGAPSRSALEADLATLGLLGEGVVGLVEQAAEVDLLLAPA